MPSTHALQKKFKSDIRTCLSVMGKLSLGCTSSPKNSFVKPGPKPSLSGIDPFPMIPRPFIFARRNEILDFHLLEFTGPENKISRRYLVFEAFPICGQFKRDFDPTGIHSVFEIRKDSLGGFRPKITKRRSVAQSTGVCLKHHVEFPRSKRTRLARNWRGHLRLLT